MRFGLCVRLDSWAVAARGVAPSAARGYAAFRQQLEPQRARHRCRFYQTNVDNITQPVLGTAARSDQRMARLVVIEILAPQRADRDQAVSAGIVQLAYR